MGGVAELQGPAGNRSEADIGAAGIGVGAGEHHKAAATERTQHRQLACADAIADIARDRQRDAVGVDGAAVGRVVDLEVVGEGEIAGAVGLERGVFQRHRAGTDRLIIGHLYRGVRRPWCRRYRCCGRTGSSRCRTLLDGIDQLQHAGGAVAVRDHVSSVSAPALLSIVPPVVLTLKSLLTSRAENAAVELVRSTVQRHRAGAKRLGVGHLDGAARDRGAAGIAVGVCDDHGAGADLGQRQGAVAVVDGAGKGASTSCRRRSSAWRRSPADVFEIAPPLPPISASEPIVLLKPPRSSVAPLPTANAEFDEKPVAELANTVPVPRYRRGAGVVAGPAEKDEAAGNIEGSRPVNVPLF